MTLQLCSTVKGDLSAVRPIRAGCDPHPLLTFEELFVPDSVDNSSNQEGDFTTMLSEDCSVPDQQALVHVTSRRKGAPRKKSLQTVNLMLFYHLQCVHFVIMCFYIILFPLAGGQKIS